MPLFDTPTLLAYLATAVVLVIIPGPGTAWIVAQTVTGGTARGLRAGFGTGNRDLDPCACRGFRSLGGAGDLGVGVRNTQVRGRGLPRLAGHQGLAQRRNASGGRSASRPHARHRRRVLAFGGDRRTQSEGRVVLPRLPAAVRASRTRHGLAAVSGTRRDVVADRLLQQHGTEHCDRPLRPPAQGQWSLRPLAATRAGRILHRPWFAPGPAAARPDPLAAMAWISLRGFNDALREFLARLEP